MEVSQAKKIFKEIEHSNEEVEEKLIAIQTLLDRGAFRNITKSECIGGLRWIMEQYL